MNQYKFDGKWESEIRVPTFELIQCAKYTSDEQESDPDGIFRLVINNDPPVRSEPFPEQLATISYILNNQALIRHNIIEELLVQLPIILKKYYGYDLASSEETFMLEFEGEAVALDELSFDTVIDLFGIQSISIMTPSKNGSSYYDVSGRCGWDEEHGLNFLLHEDKILKIGAIDGSSFWVATKDNGTYDDIVKERNLKM